MLDEFIQECESRGYADSTLESHETTFQLFSRWLETQDLTAEDCTSSEIEDFINWIKDNWNRPYNKIRSTAFWSLQKYYDYLVSNGSRETNPCSRVDVVECIILDDAERFLNRIRTTKAESTVENREYGLIQFSYWLEQVQQAELEDMTPLLLEDYAIFLKQQGYSDTTVKDRFAAVSMLYRFLSDKVRAIEDNPIDDVNLDEADIVDYKNPTRKSKELKEDIYYVTPEQKEELLNHVPGPFLRNELLVNLLWQTGIRREEAANIKIEDIEREKRQINIKGKGNKNRVVFYQPTLDDTLKIWLEGGYRSSSLCAEESPYLFLSERSLRLHPHQINQIVVNSAKNAEIQREMYRDPNGQARYKITAHSVRHGFAVQCLKNGMDIKTLADLMGHESLDTTKEYLKFTTEDRRTTYRQFGPDSQL